MKLYGKEWTRRELEARVGRIEQIGGIQRFVHTEGPEAGTEMISMRTGSGLSCQISPTKGMDISRAEFLGIPISWQSGNGDAHPHLYDAKGEGWLRTSSGGLLMTCGLSQVGAPCEDEGQSFGLHGRIHHTPARHVSVVADWKDNEYDMQIRGVMEETSIFGEQLRLTRTISSRLGESRIAIHDRVENIGFRPTPHMILYHFNFGFPLMSESTVIQWPDADVTERDSEGAQPSTTEFCRWQEPNSSLTEKVYYHSLKQNPNNFARVSIYNPSFPAAGKITNETNGGAPFGAEDGVTVELSWDAAVLPKLVQWKMPGAGTHVLGVEPANCWVGGRAKERSQGTLRVLEPGETVEYRLRLEVR
jgi:hypothetical protein